MKYLIYLICISFSISLTAQTGTREKNKHERCNTMPALEKRMNNDPVYRQFRKNAMAMKAGNQRFLPCDGANTIVIPVAFHFATDIVLCGEESCVLAEVQDQLDALNAAFGDNTGSESEAVCLEAYQDEAGNSVASTGTCISFCMAIPPAGTAANLTPEDPPITVNVYDGGTSLGGGAPGWDGILNIFITPAATCLGEADGIPGRANGDGVSVCAEVFGGTDPSSCDALDTSDFYDRGATLIHEVGHYLGLLHTHVDEEELICGFDSDVEAPGPFMVNDTPPQPVPSGDCFDECFINTDCPNALPEPTANFMSYSDDICMAMFTEDQAAVMNYWAFELFSGSASLCSDPNPTALIACVDATCDDGKMNGGEFDVDCGGPNCEPCEVIPSCDPGAITLLDENFNSCEMPDGWTTSATDGGSGIFFDEGVSFIENVADANPEFFGCVGIIDDDTADDIGVGCIITPVMDLTLVESANLVFDWQNIATNAGFGFFFVEVYDGSDWVEILLETGDVDGRAMISLDAYDNTDFQVRFCSDDEGEFAFGIYIDNVSVCGQERAALASEIPTMGEWGLIILGLLIMSCSVIAIRQKDEAYTAS